MGPVLLLHTTTLMTLFTFRLPFFHKLLLLLLLLFIYLFIIVMHVPLFCILVAEILFSPSLDSMYCHILTSLLHTAVVSMFGNFGLLCYFFNIV